MKPGLRRRLTLLVTVVAVVTVGALTAGVNLALHSSLNQDASQLLRARAQAAGETIKVKDGQIQLAPDATAEPTPDAQVWLFDHEQMIEEPQTATGAENALAAQLVRTGVSEIDDGAADLRLGAIPIRDNSGAEVGTLVTAISIEPYERTEQRTLVISILFAILVVAAMTAATYLVVGRALQPVAEMTADVAEWSAHDLDRRFRVGEPSDELTRLAATFDGLLDRVAAVLRHEKRFSAELSHELRTPLAAVAAEAELALRRERTGDEYRAALTQISRNARELTEIVETLLLAAREETTPQTATTDLRQPIRDAIEAVGELAKRCHVAISVDLPEAPMISAIEATSVRRLLAPLLENACAYAGTSVTVALAASGSEAVISISDDGPGLASDEIAAVFEPDKRGGAERNPAAPEGTGLGLSLARRLARALGGEITSVAQPTGTRFEVRLPLSG